MKSSRYLLAVAALALGFAAPVVHAADDATPPAKKEGARKAPDLKEALGLTAEQETKVKAIQADAAEKVKALKDKEPKEKRAESMKIREEANAKIEAILTPEQKAKFAELKAKRGGPKGDKGEKPKHDETK